MGLRPGGNTTLTTATTTTRKPVVVKDPTNPYSGEFRHCAWLVSSVLWAVAQCQYCQGPYIDQ